MVKHKTIRYPKEKGKNDDNVENAENALNNYIGGNMRLSKTLDKKKAKFEDHDNFMDKMM